jgi:hypothetical protein
VWLLALAPVAKLRLSSVRLAVEHAALALALVAGFALMSQRGWGVGHARWLAVKVLLSLFLLIPLETFHAYVCHVWLPHARRANAQRQIERGVGMEEMVRAIAIPLLGLAIPLLFWLSLARPF